MGIVCDKRTGICHARKKVPNGLEEATARVLGDNRVSVSWLKRSLATKDKRQANILGKPVLMEFDRVLAKAGATAKARPVQALLSGEEINRLAAYHYASQLAEDDVIPPAIHLTAGIQGYESTNSAIRSASVSRHRCRACVYRLVLPARGRIASLELERNNVAALHLGAVGRRSRERGGVNGTECGGVRSRVSAAGQDTSRGEAPVYLEREGDHDPYSAPPVPWPCAS